MRTEYLKLADYAEQAVLAIASGDWDQDDMTTWLRRYLSTIGND